MEGMMDTIDVVPEGRLEALQEIEKEKLLVAKAYNKRVKTKMFQIGESVWKTILPLETWDKKFGKWSPNWEGLMKVVKIISSNAYLLGILEGQQFAKAINGKYLKGYYSSVWQEA
jgi:hypothetical protein